jgi:O-antigen/teichoic acid export membrane protein
MKALFNFLPGWSSLQGRLQGLSSIFRVEGIDQSSQAGRSLERSRRLAWTSLTSFISKVVSMAMVFVTARLALSHLGAERYGLWITIASATWMLGFLDLGLKDGLLVKVSHAHGRGDLDAIRKFTANTFFALSTLAGASLVLSWVLYPTISWAQVFNVRTPLARAEAGPSLLVFSVCFLASLPLGIVPSLYAGVQRGFLANAWQTAGTLGALGAFFLAARAGAGLPWLVFAISAPPVIFLLTAFFLFFRSQPHFFPRREHLSWGAAKDLFAQGSLFWGISFVAPASLFSDNFIIAHFVGSEAVAGYAVTAKLFGLCSFLPGVIHGSILPSYAEAYVRGDDGWIRQTLRRAAVWVSLSVFLLALPLLFLAPRILEVWLGTAINPTWAVTLGLALLALVNNFWLTICQFLWAVNLGKYDLIISLVMTVFAFAFKWVLTPKYGVSGVVWGQMAACLLALLPSLWLMARFFRAKGRDHEGR